MISYLFVTKARGPVWEFFFSDGSSVDDLWFVSESDADHGGCVRTGRSTSGWILWFRHGAKSRAAVDFGCKRQSVAAFSTAHSEIGAIKDSWVRSVFPALGAWEQVLCRNIFARHLVDSDAARKAVVKGLSLALRYMRKAHRITLAGLHDMSKQLSLERVDSKHNTSDVLTKPMDLETLTRHLFVLGYFELEYRGRRQPQISKEQQEQRAMISRMQRLVADTLGEGIRAAVERSFVTGFGRSV